jgi:hypothetical protein
MPDSSFEHHYANALRRATLVTDRRGLENVEEAGGSYRRLTSVPGRGGAMFEILNTAAAIGTFTVIAATAIAAVIQLRHMRANNQLEGLLSVLARVEDSNFNRWVTAAQRQLPQLLADPEYRQSVVEGTFNRDVAWLNLANSYDWVGSLVKNRLIPVDAFLDVYSFRVRQAWKVLEPVTALVRPVAGDAVWENFEYLYVKAEDWAKAHPRGNYPKHVRRLTVPAFSIPPPPLHTESPAETANVS